MQIGRFRVVRLLAQGGMAEVYRAEQELTGGILRPVALKVIRPEYSESEDFREMFLDEARTACTLSHPNIVHIYEVGDADGLLFMAMELVTGESLATVARALRERDQRLTDAALLAIGAYTCSALESVHALKLPGAGQVNLVHRDVSPHNLLLSSNGALKLIDFGIAKALSNRNLTAAGVTKGKAGYFSPEQAMGKPLDGRSDVFSLGVTLYKLASGSTPFDDHATHHERHKALVAGRWQDLEEAAPGLLPGFYDVVRKALQVRVDDRFSSAADMREALESVAFDEGLPISTSALAGYVEEHDGEVTVTPTRNTFSGRHSRPRLALERTTATTDPRTESGTSSLTRTSRRWWIAAAFTASVLLGFFGVLLVQGNLPRREPPATVAASEPADERARERERVPLHVPETPSPETAPAETADLAPLTTKSTRRTQKRPTPTPDTIPAKATTREDPIAPGEGQLRIGSAPDGIVSIAGKKHGETPLNLKLRSGAYTVEVLRPSDQKRGTCSVKVYPDRTTRLRYDFAQDRCALDYL